MGRVSDVAAVVTPLASRLTTAATLEYGKVLARDSKRKGDFPARVAKKLSSIGFNVFRIGVPSPKLVVFDCDSTLSAIEGIDELARVRGPEVFNWAEAMTRDAMEGKIAVEDVFSRRLEIVKPRKVDVDAVGALYLKHIEPTAVATIRALKAEGWTPIIVSGGFRQVIAPLASHLGIARVEAVDLFFDATGNYTGFDAKFPTTRSGGKPICIEQLKKELSPSRVVMVGDGVSDLETIGGVDLFVGFGRYTERAKVKAGAKAFIYSLSDLIPLLR